MKNSSPNASDLLVKLQSVLPNLKTFSASRSVKAYFYFLYQHRMGACFFSGGTAKDLSLSKVLEHRSNDEHLTTDFKPGWMNKKI